MAYNYNFSIASRNDWPLLNSILNKGILLISREEQQEIQRKWINLQDEESGTNYRFSSYLMLLLLLLIPLSVLVIKLKKWKRKIYKDIPLQPYIKILLIPAILLVLLIILFLLFGPLFIDPLSREERSWLEENRGKIIINNEAGWPPIIDINENGNPAGIAVDYYKLIEKKLGFRFKLDSVDIWKNVIFKVKTEKNYVICEMQKNEERLQYALFTEPYIKIPNVIIVRKELSGDLTLDEMEDMKVGVGKNFAIHDYMRNNYSGLNLIPLEGELLCLLETSTKNIDAAVVNLAVALALIEKEGITNLRIAGYAGYNNVLSFASPKDLPILNSILDKGLSLITETERKRIYRKWISLEESPFYRNRSFWIFISFTALVIFSIIAMILYLNRSLKKMVIQRTESLKSRTVELAKEVEERIKVEGEREQLQNYLSEIINSMPSILVGVNKDLLVTQWNRAAETTLEIKAPEALGKEISSVLPLAMAKIEKIRESIETKEVLVEKRQARELKNRTVYEDITIYPLASENTEGAVIRIDDATKEYNLLEQLSHRSKMDAIGQLAGGIAHDFNNMLGGIIGAAELLKLSENIRAMEDQKYIDLIMTASNRASELTGKLLAFSHKGKLTSTAVDIHSILDETVSILKQTIDKKIDLSVWYNAEFHSVIGDNSSLQNAFLNICINSSHAMPGGGSIHIETKNRERESLRDIDPIDSAADRFIEIEIRDSGCGIPAENIGRIFEPFFTTKDQGKGNGLGLAAVYSTVRDHHGTIDVRSDLNSGSTFFILLPCTEEKITQKSIRKDFIKGSGLILLVDDEEILRITGVLMLKELGYEVILAENGREAVEIFKERHHQIDLVIMDMIMPEMNGQEAFLQMIKIDPGCRVIMASGFSREASINSLTKSGLKGFIRKPYNFFELSNMIAKGTKE